MPYNLSLFVKDATSRPAKKQAKPIAPKVSFMNVPIFIIPVNKMSLIQVSIVANSILLYFAKFFKTILLVF